MKGQIEDYISRDRNNPTSKQRLTAQTGLNERAARSYIAAARRRGVPIVGLLSGGYYIAKSPEEWRAFVEQERRQAVRTFKRIEIMDAETSGQIAMFDDSEAAPSQTQE